MSTGHYVSPDVKRVYNMLTPKPKELLREAQHRKYLREGDIGVWNAKERRLKQRYFFLFNDVLLLCKREGRNSYWLKVFVSLRTSLRIEDVPDSQTPNKVEFRLYAPKKTFVLFANSQEEKHAWIRDIRASCQGEYGTSASAATQFGDTPLDNPRKDFDAGPARSGSAPRNQRGDLDDSDDEQSFGQDQQYPNYAPPVPAPAQPYPVDDFAVGHRTPPPVPADFAGSPAGYGSQPPMGYSTQPQPAGFSTAPQVPPSYNTQPPAGQYPPQNPPPVYNSIPMGYNTPPIIEAPQQAAAATPIDDPFGLLSIGTAPSSSQSGQSYGY